MKKIFLLFFIAAALGSCTSYKNVPYMQDIETVNNSTQNLTLYDARIMPKDLLSITVNTTDPKAASPFNLTVQTPINAALTNINSTTAPSLQQYLVNNEGEIDFPVIGRIKVGGLTKNEAEDLIREQLKPYLKETPIREDADGKRSIHELDLTKSDLVLSPYFYLKQNDILYVTPNQTKARSSDIGTTTTTWISATSIMVSIASLIVNILR